jgi:putative DNA primase/helicase
MVALPPLPTARATPAAPRTIRDLQDAIAEACAAVGLDEPKSPCRPGEWVRCDVTGAGRKGRDDGSVKVFADGQGVIAHNWKSGEQATCFVGRPDAELSPAEREERARRREAERAKAEAELARQRQNAAELARSLWESAGDDVAGHPYLLKKGLERLPNVRTLALADFKEKAGYFPKADGDPFQGLLLVAPVIAADGTVRTLELIDEAGRKAGLAKGARKGHFWTPDDRWRTAKTVILAEGIATAWSIASALENEDAAVVATLSAGNLEAAGRAILEARGDHPPELVVAADLGDGGEPFPLAREAAKHLGARLAAPTPPEGRDARGFDFDDMRQLQGLAAVRQAIEAATELEEPQAEPIDESTLDDDARHLLEALRAIKPSAMLGKHPAEHVIGLALRHVASGIEESIGRALAREWDRLTGGRSAAIFEAADPHYSATAPLTTASIFKLAKACGWSGEVPWSEPEPLIADVEALDYPLDALPHSIRAAVEEVQAYVQAPVSLVATSALASLSLAIQSGFDVRRADKLCGPCGLFLLTIAESGERKSTIDGFFMKAIREHEREEAAAAAPVMEQYMADMEAWEAKRQGIKTKITKYAGSKDTKELEESLRKLGRIKPEAPRVPRYIYTDTTPEALAFELGKRWPTGGVISSEAGIVFGGHAMGRDSVMRNLALLNQLWDGAGLRIDRRSSESFEVNGARLTVWLQIQEQTLREFLTKTGPLARGSGFLARFLVAWPESTQGTRFYQEPPSHWPALAAFNTRLKDLLAQPPAFDEKGVLKPVTLPLSPEAKQAWIAFHDAIESELATGGELQDVRDVASKIAENAARIAALLHVFEHGGGAISLESFERASRIAAWHLNESRRFFGELAQPQDISDAARLDAWILAYCQHQRSDKIGKRYLRQYGPVRDGERLDAALAFLEELGRIRQRKSGKQATIEVNPRLLGGAA